MPPDSDVGAAGKLEFATIVKEAVSEGVGEVTVVVAKG